MIAVRGAVRVARNDRASIYHETQRLIREILARNGFERARVLSALFTMTPDLNADFPAYAARSMGWTDVPMLGAQETPVPGAMDRMVRVLLLVDAPGPAHHVYLGEAAAMRPDLAEPRVAPRSEEPGPGVEFGPVLVCGLGLIGGSIAMALRRAGRFAEVLGQDPDPRARELAGVAGAVSAVAAEPDGFLDRAETTLLCMPVEEALAWLRRHGPNLRRDTVVLDVGSTKVAVVAAMGSLPEGVEAIGTHPMAGSEQSGIGAARPDLFYGSTWALVETERTGPRARAVATAIVETTGARVRFVGAEDHDRAVAVTSHLPFLLASVLALQAAGDPQESTIRALTGPGLRDMTRLAASDPGVMAGILRTNRAHLEAAVEGFRTELDGFLRRLEAIPGEDPARTLGADRSDRLVGQLRAVRRAREDLFGD